VLRLLLLLLLLLVESAYISLREVFMQHRITMSFAQERRRILYQRLAALRALAQVAGQAFLAIRTDGSSKFTHRIIHTGVILTCVIDNHRRSRTQIDLSNARILSKHVVYSFLWLCLLRAGKVAHRALLFLYQRLTRAAEGSYFNRALGVLLQS